jgi:signal peptidase I
MSHAAPPHATEPAEPKRARQRTFLGMFSAAVREIVIVLVLAVGLSLIVKTFLVQAFYIPSGSMENTLLVGDRVVVNKLVPDVVPVKRGDVVVFSDPGNWLPPSQPVAQGPAPTAITAALTFIGLLPDPAEDHLIKRVIGLPGDQVTCCDAQNRVTVNGVPLVEPYLKPGDVPSSLSFDVTVPADKVWVMGDHRSNSEDSRFHDPDRTGAQGSVPVADLTGRAVVTVWPVSRWGVLGRFASTFQRVPDAPAKAP